MFFSKYRIIKIMKFQQIAICMMLAIICQTHAIQPQSTFSHDKNCYTQGLFFYNQTHLFQTCGLYNQSYFQLLQYKSDPFEIRNTYTSQKPWKLNVFLEGAILFKNYIYLLTWRQYVVYKLDPKTFEVVDQIQWRKQGWGLTHNQTHMFTTDGSNNIFLVNQDFKVVDIKPITDHLGRKLFNINQLQFVDGYIYANVYLDTKIVKIDFDKGKVIKQFDGSGLYKAQKDNRLRSDQVINGIAFDKKADKFILTGKHWRKFYLASL